MSKKKKPAHNTISAYPTKRLQKNKKNLKPAWCAQPPWSTAVTWTGELPNMVERSWWLGGIGVTANICNMYHSNEIQKCHCAREASAVVFHFPFTIFLLPNYVWSYKKSHEQYLPFTSRRNDNFWISDPISDFRFPDFWFLISGFPDYFRIINLISGAFETSDLRSR